MDKVKANPFKIIGFDILKVWIEVVMLSLILCTVTAMGVSAPSCYLWVASMLIYSAVGVILSHILRGLRLLQMVIGVLVCVAGTLWLHLTLDSNIPLSLLLLAVAVAFDLRGRTITEREWDEASPTFLYTIIVVFTLLFTLVVGVVPMLEPFRPIATILGPIIVVVGLLTMNTLNVRSLTDVQRNSTSAGIMAVSRNFKLQNVLLVVVVLGVVLLMSLLGPMYDGVRVLFLRLFAWLASLERAEDPGSSGGETASTGEQEIMEAMRPTGERNPFLVQLEQIFITVVTIITVIAAIAFLLYAIYKGVRKLIAYLKTLDWYQEREESMIDEYEDTRESLMDLKDLPQEYMRRMSDWLSERMKREPSWNDLKSNGEKARALYRRTLLKARAGGYKENRAYTPSQTLAAVRPHVTVTEQSLESLRTCYEQARYGEQEPDGAAVEALNREI